MSNLLCNYCSMKRLQQRAKKEGRVLKIIPSDFELGGKEVYLLPTKGTKPTRRYWVAWMMAIPKQCACD
jgi:hypothetical protein